jgi:hypothetical protein
VCTITIVTNTYRVIDAKLLERVYFERLEAEYVQHAYFSHCGRVLCALDLRVDLA